MDGRARVPAGGWRRLQVAEGAAAAVAALELRRDGTWEALERDGSTWIVPPGESGPLELRFGVDLRRAARASTSRRLRSFDGGVLAPPGAWLPHPVRGRDGRPVEVAVATAPGVELATGVPADAAGHLTFPTRDFDRLPLTVLGSFERRRVAVDGARVDLVLLSGPRRVPVPEVFDWAESRVRAVASWYGRFPPPAAVVVLEPGGRGWGRAEGHAGAGVHVPLPPRASREDLEEDWILVHELVHLGVPLLPARHHWLEEGIATYVEPLVRYRAGWIDRDEVWGTLVQNLPRGEPRAGDRGLDRTPTWGRTYWGGALFCFLADLELRSKSGGRGGLREALGGVVAAGGSMAEAWTMEELLSTGDRAAGAEVLVPLWRAMRHDPHPVDLEELWSRLGVERVSGRMRYRDDAPGAALRDAIAR